jgi:energy-coupling factor transporter ATP-binding protein EcfA2
MAIHVLVASPNVIDFDHAALRARVEARLQQPVALYRPMSFVEHSGFSETVREEIALVLANHAPDEVPLRPFEAFVDDWNLAPHLERRVLDLSGGWRKYLGLALFMNRPAKARLLLDTTTHLSDARVRTLLERAAEGGDVVFCEYDPQLLLALEAEAGGALPPMTVLADDGSAIGTEVPGNLSSSKVSPRRTR